MKTTDPEGIESTYCCLSTVLRNVELDPIITGSCEERTDGKLATYIMSLELRVNYLTLGNVPHGIRWSDDLSCALLAFGGPHSTGRIGQRQIMSNKEPRKAGVT